MFSIFMSDLVPIIVVMALGFFSGKSSVFTEDQAGAFNKLVLNYALPAALFVAIVRANRDMIFADMTLTMVSLVVLLFCFFAFSLHILLQRFSLSALVRRRLFVR